MRGDGGSMQTRSQYGRWEDLSADERSAAEEAACERYGVENFFDLDPEQRREVREKALGGNR
jgi:hypothetical protein